MPPLDIKNKIHGFAIKSLTHEHLFTVFTGNELNSFPVVRSFHGKCRNRASHELPHINSKKVTIKPSQRELGEFI